MRQSFKDGFLVECTRLELPSKCYGAALLEPKVLIWHCMGTNDPVQTLIDCGVSAHFLIYPDGRGMQLVSLNHISQNAGPSDWIMNNKKLAKIDPRNGALTLNACSISIEFHMPDYALSGKKEPLYNYEITGGRPTLKQLEAASKLRNILFEIYPNLMEVTHAEVSPYRYDDTGVILGKTDITHEIASAFYEAKIWPKPKHDTREFDVKLLAQYLENRGYVLDREGKSIKDGQGYSGEMFYALVAFARRFTPEKTELFDYLRAVNDKTAQLGTWQDMINQYFISDKDFMGIFVALAQYQCP